MIQPTEQKRLLWSMANLRPLVWFNLNKIWSRKKIFEKTLSTIASHPHKQSWHIEKEKEKKREFEEERRKYKEEKHYIYGGKEKA